MTDKHLSTQFDAELSAVSTRVLEMGGLVEAQVAQAISSAEADITHIDMGDEAVGTTAEMRILVSVRDRQHLADVLRTLKRSPAVLKVQRVKPS